ncbi:MAG: Uma2 family endonuclease [Acidobacteriota bacterium]|nr:Uma2 family endonuclease [Acidobacteriota bacterium]
MGTEAKKLVSAAEYLRTERLAETKSEFYRGRIMAMAGASAVHNAIVAAVIGELYAQLKNTDCQVMPSDLRVKAEAKAHYTYPDVTILCGKPVYEDNETDTLLNPKVIIEVLSPSTEAFDRGKKFESYRTIPSLQEYVLISQEEPKVECFQRQNAFWVLRESRGDDDVMELATVKAALPLRDIYRQATVHRREA